MQASATLCYRVAPLPTGHYASPALISTRLDRGEVGEAFSGYLVWASHSANTYMFQSQKNPDKDEL